MTKQRPCVATILVLAAAVIAYCARVRPWMYTWGARGDEIDASLPGDDWVPHPGARTVRAITIDAPAETVWPWLAQIGEGRGGFYSYSLLERAVGCDIHNADHIHPEWQPIHPGDTVWLARTYGEAGRVVVAAVKPNSHLVLVSPTDYARIRHEHRASGTWAFYLRPEGGQTRLIIRSAGGATGNAWFDVAHFVMEQKMMRGIRKRAERARVR
jgi:hypothetical protein